MFKQRDSSSKMNLTENEWLLLSANFTAKCEIAYM